MQGFFMRTTKTLIRLRGCAGWFEFTLGAQSGGTAPDFANHKYSSHYTIKYVLTRLQERQVITYLYIYKQIMLIGCWRDYEIGNSVKCIGKVYFPLVSLSWLNFIENDIICMGTRNACVTLLQQQQQQQLLLLLLLLIIAIIIIMIATKMT